MFKFLRNRFSKKRKGIPFYVVVDADVVEDLNKIGDLKNTPFEMHTITSKEEHAWEYVLHRVRIDNDSHYISWCSLKGYDFEEPQSFSLYLNNNPTVLEEFRVIKIDYSPESLAVFLRAFNKCDPIGASYESPQELKLAMMQTVLEMAEALEDDYYTGDDDDFDTSLN